MPPQPPTARLTVPSSVLVGERFTADASASVDGQGGGGLRMFVFDFGDGTQETGPNATASHTYTDPDTYPVTVTVTNKKGRKATSAPIAVQVLAAAPPPPPPVPDPAPVDCVLTPFALASAGAWGACQPDGTQTRTETWTRTVVTPAANGGAACGPLTETRTATQACVYVPPTPPPVPPPAPEGMVLGNHPWRSMTNGWGPAERNRSNGEQGASDGGPLRIRGQQFATGLGCHAPSVIEYDLPIGADQVTATLGIDDETNGKGSVVFEVWADGTRLFQSPILTGTSAPLPVSVPLVNRTVLRLVVTPGADGTTSDHADWAQAVVRAPLPLMFPTTPQPPVPPPVPPPAAGLYGPQTSLTCPA